MEGLLRKILINELTLAGYKDAYVIPSKECVMLSPKSPYGVKKKELFVKEGLPENLHNKEDYETLSCCLQLAQEAVLLYERGKELRREKLKGNTLLAEYKDTLLTARSDEKQTLVFSVWEQKIQQGEKYLVNPVFETVSFGQAKQAYNIYSGLLEQHHVFTKVQMADLSHALKYCIENDDGLNAFQRNNIRKCWKKLKQGYQRYSCVLPILSPQKHNANICLTKTD